MTGGVARLMPSMRPAMALSLFHLLEDALDGRACFLDYRTKAG